MFGSRSLCTHAIGPFVLLTAGCKQTTLSSCCALLVRPFARNLLSFCLGSTCSPHAIKLPFLLQLILSFLLPVATSPPRRCKKPKLTTKLDSLFDPSSESDSESVAGYSVCSSVASDQTKPFYPTSPPRIPVATVAFFTVKILQEQLEDSYPSQAQALVW